MGSSDTLRSVIDAGRSSKRLDELSSARVIGKIALQAHAAQQKAGHGKAVGPITPNHISMLASGEAKLELADASALGYSSPEQINGNAGDRRSDVFSLGTVLWEALTYQRLFDAMNDAAVRIAVLDREVQPPAELNANIPAELSAICMRALARNPSDRYQSLKSMAVEIEEFLDEAGYEDSDKKIASHLASLQEQPKAVKITLPPLTRPASSTQPPPTSLTPPASTRAPSQAPSILIEPPTAIPDAPLPKSPSGAALAAALANAQSGSSLPAVNTTATAIGIPAAPRLEDWQDRRAPVEATPPPIVVPETPLPPVLPNASSSLRSDKSTISVSVPPQVKVSTERVSTEQKQIDATQIDAKHVEAKPAALIVEPPAKPTALIIEEPATSAKPTLIDAPLPAAVVPTTDRATVPNAASVSPTSEATVPSVPSVREAPPVIVPTSARAKSDSDAKPRARSQSDGKLPSGAHPVSSVSLGPAPRESKDLLAGWGWGTDKHDAVPPEGYTHDDSDFDVPTDHSKKTLLYMIGGGLGLALIVTIIAVGFGGSKEKKKNPPVAAAREADRAPAPTPAAAPAPPEPTMQGGPPVDPEVEAARLEAEKAEAAKAEAAAAEAEKIDALKTEAAKLEAAKADAAAAEAAKKLEATQKAEAAKLDAKAKLEAKQVEAAQKAEAAKLAATQKAEASKLDARAKLEARKAETARLEAAKLEAKQLQGAKADAAKADAAKLEAARLEARKADAAKREAARLEAAKTAKPGDRGSAPEAPKKPEPTKIAKTTKTEPAKTVKKTEPAKTEPAKTEGKLDVETAYRIGLQQFARGDTNGALASLRTSLAGNPNYAPTWRGLGLVFEKMGERDQARAAYKRYLQLAPSAGDAEQIRSRLERLGS